MWGSRAAACKLNDIRAAAWQIVVYNSGGGPVEAEGIRRIIGCRQSPGGGVQPRHQTLIQSWPHPITVPQEPKPHLPPILTSPRSPFLSPPDASSTDLVGGETVLKDAGGGGERQVEARRDSPTRLWTLGVGCCPITARSVTHVTGSTAATAAPG